MRARYRQCPQTNKLLPIDEWNAKYAVPKGRAPYAFVKNMTPYISMVTGRQIRNHRERDYDLKSTNSRPYEGLEQEQKHADKYRKEKQDNETLNP